MRDSRDPGTFELPLVEGGEPVAGMDALFLGQSITRVRYDQHGLYVDRIRPGDIYLDMEEYDGR